MDGGTSGRNVLVTSLAAAKSRPNSVKDAPSLLGSAIDAVESSLPRPTTHRESLQPSWVLCLESSADRPYDSLGVIPCPPYDPGRGRTNGLAKAHFLRLVRTDFTFGANQDDRRSVHHEPSSR